MAFNGSGTFQRSYNWTTDKNNGVKITASRFDAEHDDFATGLSTCLTKDGQSTPTANIGLGGFKITSLGDATADTDALNRQTADARYLKVSTATADLKALLDEAVHTITDVASATTCDIGAAATDRVRITGTTTITSLGTGADRIRFVHFADALTLTHNATSLILPGAANITTVAGDAAILSSDASGNWRCLVYQRSARVDHAPPTSGTSVLKGNGTGGTTAAAATDLGAGTHTIFVPATSMTSRLTNGAASGTTETSSNKIIFRTLDFDTTTQEFSQFQIRMPKSWNEGTVTARFVWSHAATTTNFGVVWALEAVALSDDDAGDAVFGTAQQVADTGGTTNDVYVTDATSAITIAGTPAAEDWVVFQVKRVPADGSDTLAVDARLHGVTLYITTDAITDA